MFHYQIVHYNNKICFIFKYSFKYVKYVSLLNFNLNMIHYQTVHYNNKICFIFKF